MEKDGDCNDAGWTEGGEFYAYDEDKPNTTRYCWADAMNPEHRMFVQKRDDSCTGSGWTQRGEFWLPSSSETFIGGKTDIFGYKFSIFDLLFLAIIGYCGYMLLQNKKR